MISMIATLIDKGFAYQTASGDVLLPGKKI